MLQAVIGHDDGASRSGQEFRGSTAILIHADRHIATAGNQQGLIPRHGSQPLFVDRNRGSSTAPVATADHARGMACGFQMFDQSDDDRSFSRAAGGEIADDHHRHR